MCCSCSKQTTSVYKWSDEWMIKRTKTRENFSHDWNAWKPFLKAGLYPKNDKTKAKGDQEFNRTEILLTTVNETKWKLSLGDEHKRDEPGSFYSSGHTWEIAREVPKLTFVTWKFSALSLNMLSMEFFPFFVLHFWMILQQMFLLSTSRYWFA